MMRDLTNPPIFRALWAFSLPMLGSNILQSLNGSINAMWVGRFLGKHGLAATSNANLIMFMVFALIFGFGVAATVLIGQHAGRRNIDGVRRAVGAGASLFLGIGILVAILGWETAPHMLQALDTPAEIQAQATVYLRLMFAGLPPALLSLFLSMSLRGTGDSLTPLLLMIPGTLLDIGLNPLLITGAGPFPALGIAGAALSSLFANWVALALLLGWIAHRDLPIRLRGREWRYLLPEPAILKTLFTMGVPMGLQMIVMASSSLVMLKLVNALGTTTIAAFGAANQLWTYVQMPAIAIGGAASAMAAQNIGAGRWDRVAEITRAGILINLLMTGSIVTLLVLFDQQALQIFLGSDQATIDVARHINHLAGWQFILFGFSAVYAGVLRASGATIVPLFILFAALILGRLGFAMLLQPHLGADALWWAFPFGSTLSVLLSWVYYRFGNWRQAKLLLQPSAA